MPIRLRRGWVRVKRRGKSPPLQARARRHGKPHRVQGQIGDGGAARSNPALFGGASPGYRLLRQMILSPALPRAGQTELGLQPFQNRGRGEGRVSREGGITPRPSTLDPRPSTLDPRSSTVEQTLYVVSYSQGMGRASATLSRALPTAAGGLMLPLRSTAERATTSGTVPCQAWLVALPGRISVFHWPAARV